MTENMAQLLLKEIIILIDEESAKNNISEKIQDKILENCISITVDEYGEKPLIFLNEKPVSVKIPNIVIDLKQSMEIITEAFLSVSIPDTKYAAVSMIILIILKAWQLSRIYITDEMAKIIICMHDLNLYNSWMEMDTLKKYIEESTNRQCVCGYNIEKILDKLNSFKIIEMVDGKVRLKEKIAYSK